nr:PREDICTED: protein FAM117B-like [Bemisia tabaci]
MSGQNCQWVRKSSPSSKQGPMKATLPMSSLTRQNSNLRNSNNSSPTSSPTSGWKSRFSPTDSVLSGVRSPGAVTHSSKCKTLSGHYNDPLGGVSAIRRTASFDTIYLKGQWPRDSLFPCPGQLCLDKAIQTDDCSLSPDSIKSRSQQSLALDTSKNEDKLEKYIRHRLERSGKEGCNSRISASSQRERTAAFGLILRSNSPRGFAVEHGSQTRSPTSPLSIGAVNIPLSDASTQSSRQPMRSSVEGLNQEIERLVLKATSSLGTADSVRSDEKGGTPEGHRAPLADLLRHTTRSVNTQTPSAFSTTPLSSPLFDRSRPSSDLLLSGESSPDHEPGKFGASPRINKFLAREPPDGCEKVSLKFLEDNRKPMLDLSLMDYCPIKPCVNFTLKPSLGSAFYPLPRPSQSPPLDQQQEPSEV